MNQDSRLHPMWKTLLVLVSVGALIIIWIARTDGFSHVAEREFNRRLQIFLDSRSQDIPMNELAPMDWDRVCLIVMDETVSGVASTARVNPSLMTGILNKIRWFLYFPNNEFITGYAFVTATGSITPIKLPRRSMTEDRLGRCNDRDKARMLNLGKYRPESRNRFMVTEEPSAQLTK